MTDNRLRAPHQLRMVFLTAMLLLAVTLGVLGWQLLLQDQELSAKRLGDQRDAAAGLAVIALERRISSVERELTQILADGDKANVVAPAADAIFFQIEQDSMRVWPHDRLIYYPELAEEAAEAMEPAFAIADELELKGDHAGVIAALQDSAVSSDLKIRAAALARIAGNYRQAKQPEESLKSYAKLADLGAVSVGGLPAALSGRLGALKVFEQQNDQASLLAAARALVRDVNDGRHRISFAAYESLSAEARRFLPEAEESAPAAVRLAEGVDWLWEQRSRNASSFQPGRHSLSTPSGPLLIVWRVAGNNVAGFAAGVDYLEAEWLAELTSPLAERRARLSLTDPQGRAVSGGAATEDRPAIQLASVTGLPWTVQVFSTVGPNEELGSRRKLMATGMAVLLVLILLGAWFVGQAVSRELAVARLKSDFVSVVSHEFRTPLTTLCQLSELLQRGRVKGDKDRQQCYDFLHNESQRLRRLVESLLDFGRLESGKMQFRFEEIDAAAFLRQATAEFAEGQQTSHRVELAANLDSAIVRVDRDTLRCVFWNLLENAVKYSPDSKTVWVDLARKPEHVEIAIRDSGVGIPPGEQRRIFEKFVRGSAARESGIRGTGIGLATAREIVHAHGGEITLESEPGKGSTFRVLLPL